MEFWERLSELVRDGLDTSSLSFPVREKLPSLEKKGEERGRACGAGILGLIHRFSTSH